MNDTIKRLEGLQSQISAARDTQHAYPGVFSEGLKAGLRIALQAVEFELQSARNLEAALAAHQ